MKSALIGATGFVGGTLSRSLPFDHLCHRANVESLRGASLERVICAGLPAAKWIANLHPDQDLDNVRQLEGVLDSVEARIFILISTIDVYPQLHHADEQYDCGDGPNHAYGRHRLRFERFVRGRFPHAHIVRLPALVGTGLKKNVVYDLLHGKQLERINPRSRFQWYPLARLAADLEVIEKAGLPLVNLFTEPVVTRDILDQLFSHKTVGVAPDPEAHYDLRTRYGEVFGGVSPYMMSREQVMTAVADFVRSERSAS